MLVGLPTTPPMFFQFGDIRQVALERTDDGLLHVTVFWYHRGNYPNAPLVFVGQSAHLACSRLYILVPPLESLPLVGQYPLQPPYPPPPDSP